jgi:hypothetical protein
MRNLFARIMRPGLLVPESSALGAAAIVVGSLDYEK